MAEYGGARQCVPADDKEGSGSTTTATTELEVAARGKNTILVPKDSSRSARLLVAIPQGEIVLPCAEADRRQGHLVHRLAHLLQPLAR